MSVSDKVAETVCHCAALRQAARRVTHVYDRALAPTGLRITQYPILALLASGPSPMNALAARLVLDRATLGHNLRPLAAQGLVTIAAGADKRSRVVTLTEAGQTKLRDARPGWRAAQAVFEDVFGAADAAALRANLARLARLDFGPTDFGPTDGA